MTKESRKVKNVDVLKSIKTKLYFTDMIKRKIRYTRHVLRSSRGLSYLQILADYVTRKRKVRCNMDDGYYGMDMSGKLWNCKKNCVGEKKLETHSCQSSLSFRKRQINEWIQWMNELCISAHAGEAGPDLLWWRPRCTVVVEAQKFCFAFQLWLQLSFCRTTLSVTRDFDGLFFFFSPTHFL